MKGLTMYLNKREQIHFIAQYRLSFRDNRSIDEQIDQLSNELNWNDAIKQCFIRDLEDFYNEPVGDLTNRHFYP